MAKTRYTYFATCAPGIEPLLHAEIRALKLAKVERQVGGVRFDGTEVDGWNANLRLRTAIRVLRRLSVFEAHSESELYEFVRGVEWKHFVRPNGSLVVNAQTKNSELDHSLYIAQITKDAVCDQLVDEFGERPNVDRDDPDLTLHVHVNSNRVTLSLDTSGVTLHKRGWRQFQGTAPLSETLAAAIVLLSNWDRKSPLVDPFCGSGTLLVEAALIAGNVAPGLFRERFGFERLPGHDERRWLALRDAARGEIAWPRKLMLRGGESDAQALDGARDNLRAAGIEANIELVQARAEQFDFKPGWNGWIITNPPYGERIGERDDLAGLYASFGAWIQERCAGYALTLLSGNEMLTERLALPALERIRLMNGAIPCQLLRGTL